MSKQTNKPDKNLEALFDKNKGLGNSGDAFEQDALEGFAALNNQQEAFDLKAALDEKISQNGIFRHKKKLATYWLAAAGFLLVVGLSVYFISGSSPEKNNLAISTVEVPRHEIKAPRENSDQALKKPEQELPQITSKNEAIAKRSLSNSSHTGPPASEAPEIAFTETKSDQAADFAYEEKGMAAQTAPIVAKPQAVQVQNETSESEENFKSADPKKENKTAVAGDKKNKASEKDAPGSAAADRLSISENIAKAKESESATGGALYPGGESALNKMIKEKLGGQDNDQAFDARLFINQKGEVEKAELIKPSGLKPGQQKKLLETLKSLKGFTFISAGTENNLAEYHLIYR
jgi:hypothetical protein